jgi:hypothetical protein
MQVHRAAPQIRVHALKITAIHAKVFVQEQQQLFASFLSMFLKLYKRIK